MQLGELTSVTVLGDAQSLNQATLALVDNALHMLVAERNHPLDRSRWHQGTLTIHDTGPGIAAEHLPLLGQRLYPPAKPVARGRGRGSRHLGGRGILALHHGALDLASGAGRGYEAILRIPAITLIDRPDKPNESDIR